ncbi:MAG TPA: DUF1573 domain-containing protein [Chitinophagaceae bacterium]|nr:DUF1573 domain-containing protein [Chitinophagaceae bacterium]
MRKLFIGSALLALVTACGTREKQPSPEIRNAVTSAIPDSAQTANITLSRLKNPFGSMSLSEKITDTFTIFNNGPRTFYIHEVSSRCDCVEVLSSHDSIPPGKTAVVRYAFSPQKKGFTRQTILLIGNCQNGHYPFFIEGQVN